MKKLLFTLIAALLLTGTVYAAGIPTASDPQNYPEVWTCEVYNNSGAALTSGRVVVWDCASDSADASYANRTMWVTTSATAGDGRVAGVVVDPSIPSATAGTIAIWGPVYALCADSSNGVTVDTAVANSSVSGQAGDAASGANATLGFALASGPIATTLGGYGGSPGADFVMIPIFVDTARAD